MHESDLRAVLLVKAIEESDREGLVLPRADRLAAAREAKRAAAPDPLAHRARALLAKVVARHPFVGQVAALAGGVPWVGTAALAAGLLLGAGLSALDGTRRINVLAFPLLGLVAWNLAVYAVVIAGWARSRGRAPPRRWLPALAARAALARAAARIARSRAFDALLGEALSRFALAWQEAARPVLVARAARTLHLAAAAAGAGLVAGLYLRGIAFDYRAGWESTFLDAHGAHALLTVLYGPASWVTGIGVPDVAHLEAIRWRDAGGGEGAGPWIHLLAATAVLYVVIPRLALALASGAFIARWSRAAPAPASLAPYAREAFRGVGGLVEHARAAVFPVAYEPSGNALARLRTLLAGEIGERPAIEVRPPVRYGEEEAFAQALEAVDAAGALVLLFSLAATPEDENHGLVMAAAREHMAGAGGQLLVLVDEGPYRARMGTGERLAARRLAWSEFVAARGLEPRIVDLAP